MEYVVDRKADVILRITPNNVRLVEKNGEIIDMAKRLKTDKSVIEINCFIKGKSKLLPIRIIASRLPEDKRADAIKRKIKTAKKKQQKIKPETLIYAEWVIIATTLDDTYTNSEILTIYRSRWQIELLFKRIKQHFNVTKIKASTPKYAVALITLWLIVWTLSERQIILHEWCLIKKGMGIDSQHSAWTLSSYCFLRIKTVIESVWSILLDPVKDIEIIKKRLQNHKSSRVNQYANYHWCNFTWD